MNINFWYRIIIQVNWFASFICNLFEINVQVFGNFTFLIKYTLILNISWINQCHIAIAYR